jgi:hypothetical protein
VDRISKVSFSRLQNFEKCKYLAKLMYIDRIPEPERPLPPGKTEHANDRGLAYTTLPKCTSVVMSSSSLS